MYSNTCSGDWCDIGGAIMVLIFSFPGLFVGEMLPQALLDILPAMYVGIGINTLLLYGIGLGITKIRSQFSQRDVVTQ